MGSPLLFEFFQKSSLSGIADRQGSFCLRTDSRSSFISCSCISHVMCVAVIWPEPLACLWQCTASGGGVSCWCHPCSPNSQQHCRRQTLMSAQHSCQPCSSCTRAFLWASNAAARPNAPCVTAAMTRGQPAEQAAGGRAETGGRAAVCVRARLHMHTHALQVCAP